MDPSKTKTAKSSPRRLIAVCSPIIILFAFFLYLAIKLANRDATDSVDYGFKVFGAFFAFVIGFFGPFGMIGLALMSGRLKQDSVASLVYRLTFAALVSFALLGYVMYRFDAFEILKN